ncbi:MAG: hypothetical protein R6X32_15040 [Chloroflexota bacterium]
MKKYLFITLLWLVTIGVVTNVLLVKAAPPLQQIQAADAIESLFTTVRITPNINLPDGDPTFTCFDMPLAVDPAARIVDVEVVVAQTHTWVGDLIYQIWNPDGQHVTMMHRPGRTGSGFGDSSNLLTNSPLTFGNAYTDDAETMGNTLGNTDTICLDDGRCHYFPNRDEDLASLASFAGMAGGAVAGTWQFCASDNGIGDTGPLSTVTLHVNYTMPDISACTIGGWQPVAAVHTGRSRVGLTYSSATGNFYLVGGEAEGGDRNIPIEEYDPTADVWTEKSNLTVGVSNSGATAVGAYIYVPGGYDGTSGRDDMQRYDPVADEVAMMAPMPAPNSAHGVTTLDGKVYVMGGSPTGIVGTTNYIYDVAANEWHTGAPLPVAVQYTAVTNDGAYIYVMGGNTTNLATVQRYDPITDNWDALADMKTGRGGPAAFFDGVNLWAVGGGWSSYLASTEYWDGAAWQTGPALNTGARTVGAAYGGGMALKAAGWNGTYLTEAELLSLDCGQPDIEVNPGELSLTLGIGQAAAATLTINNTGNSALEWTTTEAPPLRPVAIPDPVELPPLSSQIPVQPGETLSSYVEYGLPFPDTTPYLPLDFPVSPVGGGLSYYADRNAFNADNPGLPVEDFEAGNVSAGSVRACPAPFDTHTNNECFNPGELLPGILFQDDPGATVEGLALLGPGFNNNPSISLVANTLSEAFHIYFTAPVNAVGMDLQSHFADGLVDITVYAWDGTTVLGATPAAATNSGNFWGVVADQPIGRITIYSPSGEAEGVDNLAFGYVGVCSVPADIPWATATPANGATAPGASDDIQVMFDTSGLTVGNTYTGTLCINSNDPDEPHVVVPLSLTVDMAKLYLPAIVR